MKSIQSDQLSESYTTLISGELAVQNSKKVFMTKMDISGCNNFQNYTYFTWNPSGFKGYPFDTRWRICALMNYTQVVQVKACDLFGAKPLPW